jgi:integrase
MGTQSNLDFLNEGLDGKTEYRFYFDRDVLAIWFYVGADRKRKTTSLTCPEALTPAWRAEARRVALELVTGARTGRVLTAQADDRVRVSSTIEELRDAWVKTQEVQYPASWKTKKIQIQNVVRVFSAAKEVGTPLQRMVDDYGPQRFVNARMRQVAKDTVVKEVAALFQFLTWLHLDKKFITKRPPRPEYRAKDLGTRVGPQRDHPVELDDETALKIILLLPEYAHSQKTSETFACRDMMRFAFETGLRPSTVGRLVVGEHWVRGKDVLKITADIDKGRNTGSRGKPRFVPLTQVAKEILEQRAPKSGAIFGMQRNGRARDIRVQWKRAAIEVLGREDGERCAPYDLRHGANFRMAEAGGTVGGRMHMLGQSKASTNDKYMRPSEKAAADIVGLLDKRNRELDRKLVRKVVRKASPRSQQPS